MEKVYVVTEMFQDGLKFEFDEWLTQAASTHDDAIDIMLQSFHDAYDCFAEIYDEEDIVSEIDGDRAYISVPGCDEWLCEISCCTLKN